MKLKFLFVSKIACISDIAWQVSEEGHNVLYSIENSGDIDVADGFVPKVDDWRRKIDWADVIVFDDTLGFGVEADALRKKGKYVIGGTEYTDRLEDDRSFGQKELKKAGVNILQFEEFHDFDEAISFVQENPNKYVIKPCGDVPKRFLFVGVEDDGSDVVRMLEAYKRVWAEPEIFFQLQKRVTGVEVAVGAFFNGKEFLMPININFEHKKLFPGNIGPSTGEMGTSMFWTGPNKLFAQTLKKMEPLLIREGYVGYIDINCIVNGTGIFPLEFTSRFGYPTISVQQEGISMPISEFLYMLARGDSFEIKTKKGFQIGVRIALPPFPFGDRATFEAYSKDSVIVFKKRQYDGIHIEDVKIVNGEWVVTGDTGVVLIVVGSGMSMKEAQQQAYRRIDNIMIPNMYYRKDIGDRWVEDSDKLHSWGYLR